MKIEGFLIQDGITGKWLLKDKADIHYIWTNNVKVGNAVTLKELKDAWLYAATVCPPQHLSVYVWRHGTIENIRQLKTASFLWCSLDVREDSQFHSISRVYDIATPKHITGIRDSYWVVELGVNSRNIRIYKGTSMYGAVHDILVPYTLKTTWYAKRMAKSQLLRGSIV